MKGVLLQDSLGVFLQSRFNFCEYTSAMDCSPGSSSVWKDSIYSIVLYSNSSFCKL